MILTNILLDNTNPLNKFYLTNQVSPDLPKIEFEGDLVDPKNNSIADVTDLINLNMSKVISSFIFKVIWEYSFVGPSRFKISDRVKFQFDPTRSHLNVQGTVSDVDQTVTQEISQVNLDLLLDKAELLGYQETVLNSVQESLNVYSYLDSTTDVKGQKSHLWDTNIVQQKQEFLPSLYDLVKEQHSFWVALKEQVLTNTGDKTLCSIDTLGNTVPFYSYGNTDSYKYLKCLVEYRSILDNTRIIRTVNFDLVKPESDITYIRSDIFQDVQVLWVNNGLSSFVKVLYNQDLIATASIKYAKLFN